MEPPDDGLDTGGPDRMASAKRLLAVASGKGGVGKSTVAVNLALGLSQIGYRVGLLDADVHGPNVPLMLGVRRKSAAIDWQAIIPLATAAPRKTRLPTLERYGLRTMSLGLLASEEQALLPDNAALAGLLVRGLLEIVDWGELDLLLLDLPPGTGEPLATILATVHLDGVVLVSTPQDVARLDTGRTLASFQQASVPVLGVVENMAFMTCPQCGERLEVFHRGTAPRAVGDGTVPLLTRLPLDPAISEAADTGRPLVIADPDGYCAAAFVALARAVAERLSIADSTPRGQRKEGSPPR